MLVKPYFEPDRKLFVLFSSFQKLLVTHLILRSVHIKYELSLIVNQLVNFPVFKIFKVHRRLTLFDQARWNPCIQDCNRSLSDNAYFRISYKQ